MTGRNSGVTKSRHGCRRCKTKRIKCDEAVPACTNCLQRGWQCPGYGPNIRWSTKHERFGVLSQASQAAESGESPIPQTSQQLYNYEDHSPYRDRDAVPLDAGNHISGAVLDDSLIKTLPPQLPITPVSQCTYDDNFNIQEDLPANSLMPISSPAYDIGDCYTLDVPELHGPVNSHEKFDTASALTLSGHVASYTGMHECAIDPRIFYTPTHIPTILIEHWFSDVCPMWNIFDSDSNFNRQFASASWSSSEPVFFAMQSMSAACLVDTLPAMMPVLSSLTSKALAAIRCRVSFYQDGNRTAVPTFPTDLLFAIFAMGTSLHWKHGFELGGTLLKYAHCVIDCYRKRLPSMEPSERKHLAFFQKALICWEGILSAADRNFTPASFIIRKRAYQARIRSGQDEIMSQQRAFGPRALSVSDTELHPWCGVSSDVLQKFGQVMTLCHLAQDKQLMHIEEDEDEKNGEIGLAHELASELAHMDFNQDTRQVFGDDQFSGTNDSDTPLSHLIGIAEAYRQACFLQLCLTFEDLPIDAPAYSSLGLQVPAGSGHETVHEMTRAQSLVGLSLRLVESLKRIPPESGSRCMQPLLYLCAASGLQLNPLPPLQTMPTHARISNLESADIQYGLHHGPQDHTQPETSLQTVLADPMLLPSASKAFYSREADANPMLTVSAFKVAQARSFVKKRLGMLQQLLPPRYTETALKLAEAIWAEYDCASTGGSPLYWFDVMVREKLQTFFG